MSKPETANEAAPGASLSNTELETDDNGMEVFQAFVIDSLPHSERMKKLWMLRDREGPGMSLDEINRAVAIARGGMGPEEMCVEYFERIAELKNALRDCIKIFDLQNGLARPSDACVPPRPEYVDKLRDVVSNAQVTGAPPAARPG